MNENTAIYGLSSDPPTLAHQSIVEQILTKTHVEKIIINPSWERSDKSFEVNQTHRRELIDIYMEVLKDKGLNVELDDHFFNAENGWNTTTYEEWHYFKRRLWIAP